MSSSAVLARVAAGVLALLAVGLGIVGGLAIAGSGLVAVGLAAVVAACVAAGISRDAPGRRSPADARQASIDAAWRTAVVTVVALLVVSGAAVLGGPVAAILVIAAAGVWALARWLRRGGRVRPRSDDATVLIFPTERAAAGPGWVRGLTVGELGQAWVRSSGALATTSDPAAREHLVVRRSQALDELERRDPVGFARWLAEGATIDSDPAGWVTARPDDGSAVA